MSLLLPIIQHTPTDLITGEYVGILFRIVEKGTQEELFKQTNQLYQRPKVLFTWVLPDHYELVQKQPRPVLIHKEYTQSLRQSSHLFRDVMAIRGYEFSESELTYPFDLLSLLGTPCLLSVQVTKKGEAFHPELKQIKPLPPETDVPDCPYDLYSLTFKDWQWELYDELSQKAQQEIARSPEYAKLPARVNQLTHENNHEKVS